MRAVVQRVREAEVTVGGESVGVIGHGLVVLAGFAREDGAGEVAWMADKIVGLRLFDAGAAALRDDVRAAGGGILAVSQFTLLADCRKGRRPSFDRAMPAERAAVLFDDFVAALRARAVPVATGRFGADMRVRLVNEGPFTLVVDSRDRQNSDSFR